MLICRKITKLSLFFIPPIIIKWTMTGSSIKKRKIFALKRLSDVTSILMGF